MPEGNAATQGAPGAGGPGSAGQPSQPPAQPEGAAAPQPGGAAQPAGSPQATPPPGQGAVAGAPETARAKDPWSEAAQWRTRAEQAEKRVGDRQGEIARVRSVENRLKELHGDDYMAAVERLAMEQQARAARAAAPEPVVPIAPPQVVSAGQRGLEPTILSGWIGDVFQKLYFGYAEGRPNPETGEVEQVRVPPDLVKARGLAEELDAVFRAKGVRPPWDGLFNLGQPAPQPQPQAGQQQPGALTLDAAQELLDQRDAAREAWEGSFYTDLSTISEQELGEDWFQEQVTLEINGKQETTSRERALYKLCKPTRQNPGGMPLRAGLMQFMPGDLYAQRGAVAFNAGMLRANRVGGGVMPGAAQAGLPTDPSARKQRADELQRRGVTGGNWAPEPPDDAAPVVQVFSSGGRSSGLPR